MTQIVVTLDNGADEKFLRRMIENMKGVVKTSLRLNSSISNEEDDSQFMNSLHSIRNAIDPKVIDLSDSRTNYIMSK